MNKIINIPKLKKTCAGCPAQWEGKTINGEDVYIRYRWGQLRLDINDQTIIHDVIGDGYDGLLDIDELRIALLKHNIFIGIED